MKKSGKKIIAGAALAIVLAVCGLLFCNHSNSGGIIATVNGLELSAEEFLMAKEAEKQEVVRYFREKYDADENGEFWTSEFQGEVPEEMWKQATLKTAVKNKLEQAAALENHIIEDISYDKFKEKLEEENGERRKRQENQQVVYGPERFEEQEYYHYWMSNLRLALKQKMAEQAMMEKEVQLKAFYVQVKDLEFQEKFESVKHRVAEMYVHRYYSQYIQEAFEQADIAVNETVWKKIKMQ